MIYRIKNNKFFCVLFTLILIVVFTSNGLSKIISIKIKPEKEKVLPSEVIDVEVFVSYTKDNNEVLYIEAFYGDILSENSSESSEESGRIFYPKEGQRVLKFQYKAPKTLTNMDFIMVWSASLKEEDNGTMSYKKIKTLKSKEIKLLHPNLAIITYHSFFKGNSSSGDINIKLKLKLKSGGAKSIYSIETIKVIKSNGYVIIKHGNRTEKAVLISVNPQNISSIIQLSFDSKGRRITSVRFPIIYTTLNWRGQETFVPEKSINIGPVSKENRKQRDKNVKSGTNRLRHTLSTTEKRKRRMSAFMNFLKKMNPPDFDVQGGNGIRYVWGGGKAVKQLNNGKKEIRYKWELFVDRPIK